LYDTLRNIKLAHGISKCYSKFCAQRRYSANNKQAQGEHWKLIDHCEKLVMMFDEKKAQHISEVIGQKVYLCSAHCKSQFDQI
jgi:hypothetical protein